MSHRPKKIISGGQTGADRGGLDAAMDLDIEHGGWCPKGRRAEDGRVPAKYEVRELTTVDYAPRTRVNVEESDGTAVFVRQYLTPGSRKTVSICHETGKPYIILRLINNDSVLADELRDWATKKQIRTLNVAGTRASKCRGIQQRVRNIVRTAFE